MSPYEDWQKLAWGGAALIAIVVLAINIIARLAFSSKKQA
jgi:phosphate transport system permease protein